MVKTIPHDISPSDELHELVHLLFSETTEKMIDGRFLENIEIVLSMSDIHFQIFLI
jgi:hypothetical protein